MRAIDSLIHAKWIITCENGQAILEDHALAIDNKKIIAILPSHDAKKNYAAKEESHYNSHAILPGLINCHTHVSMNLFRGLADDLELMDWLNNHIWPAEGKWVDEAFVFDASKLAMAEMIRSGTTCFNDMYFFPEATARAAEIAGMRAHIGMTIIDVPTAFAKTTEEYFEKAKEFYEQYKHHDLIIPTFAPHSTYTVSLDHLRQVNELARDYQLKINIHLQEAPSEMEQSLALHHERPLNRLKEIDMLSSQLIAIHMTQLNDNDIELVQEKKVNIVHCPESNMKLACGAAPIEALTKKGVNVALGTDGAASNNDLDMFGEMRSAAFLAKLATFDPKALPAEKTLELATINGAKALGIDGVTGSLAVGKSADFIAIDFDSLETQPLYHPVSQLVYATPRNQVTDVWVAGKQLLKNRQLLTLDEKELLANAKNWRKKIKT